MFLWMIGIPNDKGESNVIWDDWSSIHKGIMTLTSFRVPSRVHRKKGKLLACRTCKKDSGRPVEAERNIRHERATRGGEVKKGRGEVKKGGR